MDGLKDGVVVGIAVGVMLRVMVGIEVIISLTVGEADGTANVGTTLGLEVIVGNAVVVGLSVKPFPPPSTDGFKVGAKVGMLVCT